MLIKSQAGEFDIAIEKFEVEGSHLVMVGKMGVWDARTYLTARELISVLGQLINPAVIGYLLRVPFLLIRSRKQEHTEKHNA